MKLPSIFVIENKYRQAFKTSWQESMQYRTDYFGKIIRIVIGIIIAIFVWKAVFSQTDKFDNYTLSSMITYLVIAQIIGSFTRKKLSREIADEIKDGQLSLMLLKPVRYFKWQLYSNLASSSTGAIITFFLIIAFLVFLPQYLSMATFKNFLLFLFFLPFSFLFNFLVNLLLAGISFWIIDTRLFHTLSVLVINFLAGRMLPIDIMPKLVRTATNLLPFKYIIFFPINVYHGHVSSQQLIVNFFTMIAWLAILLFLVRYQWRKGLKKYEAVDQ